MDSYTTDSKFDSILIFLGIITIAVAIFLYIFSLFPSCPQRMMLPKGTVINGLTLERDTDYNTLAQLGLVYGPVAGSSAICK